MHIIKPTWLAHADAKRKFEVYSCHVSADGLRLATGGLDGAVRIWSTEAILNAGDENYNGPKQLTSMNTHSGAVLAVRWSGTNRYLASGSDDKIVLVYEKEANAAPARAQFGSSEPGNTESWRTYRRLAGHENDVQDVGWSNDSSILVSVGLDSRVIVWSGSTFERLKRLDVHQSHVKGLTFDPANKYFATASDDRSIKIFRFTPPAANTNVQDQQANFIAEATITKPFEKSPITTYFRRCSWSPDGSHIGAANATNGPVSSVAIINRGTWDSDINLIGHEGPVEVCAFSPRMFSITENYVQSSTPLVSVIACAGQDKSVSIWNTSSPRPLIIVQDIATKTISDLAWSPDGKKLFITSLDGSIVIVVFDDGDVGYVVGLEENEKLLQKFGAARKGAGIPESVEFLRLEEQGKAEERREVEGRMGELMMDGGATNGTSIDTDMSGTVPATNGNQWQMQIHGQADNKASPAATTTNVSAAPVPDPAPEKRIVNQRITITKDGRKRVAPMLVSSNSSSNTSNFANAQLMASQNNASGRGIGPQGTLDLSRPYEGLPKGGLAALLLGNKRKNQTLEEDAETEETSTVAKRKTTTTTVVAANTPALNGVPEFIRPAVVQPSMSVSQIRLGVPRIRSIIVRAMDKAGDPAALPDANGTSSNGDSSITKAPETVFEARNNTKAPPNPPDPTRLTCTRETQIVWQDFLPRAVVLLTGNANFYAAACEDGSVHVYTPAGRRLCSPLVLEAAPCFFESRGWWLMVITAVGLAHVWDLQNMKSKFPAGGVSLAPIFDIASINSTPEKPFSKAEAITEANVNGNGHVIVCLTNGDGFLYSGDMGVWERITEAWWAHGSQFWDTSGGSASTTGTGTSAGIIPFVERRTTTEVLLHGRGKFLQGIVKKLLNKEGWEGFETAVSISHLENRMAAAKELVAKEDFKMYLTMYARRIAMEKMKHKVEELCRELMGKVDNILVDEEDADGELAVSSAGDELKEDLLCGWDKKRLLRDCLLIFGKHRELQRITVPYARVMGMMDIFENGDV